jgi:peptide/nickel transport system substrate-binding protein
VTPRGRRPGWWRGVCLFVPLLAVLAAATSGASGAPTTTPVTYIGVAGGSISFGTTEGPTGCNPNTPVGDSPGTQLVLDAVLPSPYIPDVVDQSGSPEQNPNLIVQAELVSTKPETIVYTLNPHAVWSDGVPITAKDFRYAWAQQRGAADGTANAVASIAGYRDIKSVKGSDKGRTVTVVFRTPFADWEMLFANLLPAHIMEKVGWNPACATVNPAIDLSGGPYQISKVSGQTITLVGNPKWWGTPPNNRKITVHIASETAQLAQWMRTGFVQVALPNTVTPAFLDQMTSLPDVQSSVNPSASVLQLEMASGPASILTPDMRFAIALSVDRQALVTQQVNWALPGVEVASSHIYAQGQSGYHAAPLSTTTTVPSATPTTSTSTSTTVIGAGGMVNFPTTPSLVQANALMVASGYSRTAPGAWHSAFGASLPIDLVVDEGDPWAAATASQLRAQLMSAGFAVTLSLAATATQAGELLADNQAELALLPLNTSPFLSQALAWYSPLLGAPGQDGSQDWSDYDGDTYNDLVTQASQQLSATTAAVDYTEADGQLWDDVVALPLFVEPSVLVWSRKLGEMTPTPTSDTLLWYGQYWAVRVPESTSNTTPSLPNP